MRSAAWLAFLRDAAVLTWGRVLPPTASPAAAVPADAVPLFYPGAWYGTAGPLPTVQLKWLRQATQDHAVLRLTAAAGDGDTAVAACRVIAKPVDVAAPTDPAANAPQVALLGGTTEGHACDGTRALLMDRIVDRRRGAASGTASGAARVDVEKVRWLTAHERPTAFATGVRWSWAGLDPATLQGRVAELPDPGPGSWVTALLDVNVYDPALLANGGRATFDNGPGTWTGNLLQWQTTGAWEQRPAATYVPTVPGCGVRSMPAVARFDVNRAGPAVAADARSELTLSLVDQAEGQTVDCPLVLPVATSARLDRDVTLDGNLDDWSAADGAWLGRPLVRMSSRPAVQAGQARPAANPTSLYTAWTEDDLFVAFRVAGVRDAGVRTARTFTVYQAGRAWGDDLCELTVQPVYVDDTIGPALHVVCKTGSEATERQPPGGGDWQPFEGAALRYAATVDPATGVWRGELSIPWRAIAAEGRGRPSLLRFNFGQHVHATGESATWAGPVDQRPRRRHGRAAGGAGAAERITTETRMHGEERGRRGVCPLKPTAPPWVRGLAGTPTAVPRALWTSSVRPRFTPLLLSVPPCPRGSNPPASPRPAARLPCRTWR